MATSSLRRRIAEHERRVGVTPWDHLIGVAVTEWPGADLASWAQAAASDDPAALVVLGRLTDADLRELIEQIEQEEALRSTD